MLTVAFGQSTADRAQIQWWCNRFKEGRENITDDDRPDRPRTSATDENFEAKKKNDFDNRRITITEIADNISISFSSCQAFFTDIFRHKTCGSEDCSKNITQEMLTSFKDDPDLLKMVITGDESLSVWL